MSELVSGGKITINGKDYPLKYNFRAMLNFQRLAKQNFFAFMNELAKLEGKLDDFEKIDIEKLAILFQSFIIGGGQNITLDEATDLLDFDIMIEFLKLVPALMKKGNPPKKEPEAVEKKEGDGNAEDKKDEVKRPLE